MSTQNVQEFVIACPCGKGTIYQTLLETIEGLPVICYITEGNEIVFNGLCSACGARVVFTCDVITLFYDETGDKNGN